MKRVFIVHGWSSSPEDAWIPWLKEEMEKQGFVVYTPLMPDPDEPKIDAWVLHLSFIVGQPDSETFFVGHSVGCQAILRYLERTRVRIGGAVFVAGWLHLNELETDEEKAIAGPWLKTPVDFEKIKHSLNRSVAIFSDNDPWVPLEENSVAFQNFGSRILIEHGQGHFSSSDGVDQLPIAFEAVCSLVQKIGFASGAMYRFLDRFSQTAIDAYARTGSELIEVSINEMIDIDRSLDVVPFIKDFSRTSIHLPTDFRYANDEFTKKILDKTFELYQAISAELVVIHPDLVDDATLFDQYPMSFAAENMNSRKRNFKETDDIQRFFEEHPSWGMVLDVNHCFSNDPTMKLADEFIEKFLPRIRQVHVSGYTGYHEPLYQTKQDAILTPIKTLPIPIIIESTFDSIDEVQKEFDYVKNFLFSERSASGVEELP